MKHPHLIVSKTKTKTEKEKEKVFKLEKRYL